jgi:hypothetical protein
MAKGLGKPTGGRVADPLAHFSRIELTIDTASLAAAHEVHEEVLETLDRLSQDLGVVGWYDAVFIEDLNAR